MTGYVTVAAQHDRRSARMVADIVGRIARTSRGGSHVDIVMQGDLRYAGELVSVSVRDGRMLVDMRGPDAPLVDIDITDIVSVRSTRRDRCSYCKRGY